MEALIARLDWKTLVAVAIVGSAYWGGLYLLWRKLERSNRSQQPPQYGSQYTEALAKSSGLPARNASPFEAGGRPGGWLSD